MLTDEERVAKYIAVIRGLNSWEKLPVRQNKLCGEACQEVCFRQADRIIAMLPDTAAAYKKGQEDERERIIDALGIYENEFGFCIISNHVPYSSLKESK